MIWKKSRSAVSGGVSFSDSRKPSQRVQIIKSGKGSNGVFLMSSKHNATCQCGFETEVEVGGYMKTYLECSYFPYYCSTCGLVHANIQLAVPVCPDCASAEIKQYGKPPVSIPTDSSPKTLCAWDYTASAEGNLCPSCKQMTLVFHHAHSRCD